jgi:hypothetical protein
VETGLERQAEDVPADCVLGFEFGVGLRRHGQIALTTEIEGLECDRDRFPVLVTQAKPQASKGVCRHRFRLAARRER